ncbi:hypothetical protein [Granulibacter bethesdensis]|uniref:hypothetical protein n=1 Tax=Granulibacter bethesdensis TaxID=364410 RepID=UPI0009338A9D|nr:hypothetical protein [Granulibacter bethesdensis]
MSAALQLGLPFAYEPAYRPWNFLEAPSNRAARAWLARTAEWPQARLGLFGDEGTGKTHLLSIWADLHGAERRPGPSLRGLPRAPLAPVAIDDADATPDEAALLHLINAAAEAGVPILLASRLPPARWRVTLPDLVSRLRATSSVGILPPDDALLRALLERLLTERQLSVPPSLQSWLLLRLPRTAWAVREVAARLDRAALAEGGRVTKILAARILSGLCESDGDEACRDSFASDADEILSNPPALL